MARRRVVADKKEALKSISEIMRDDESKTADKMKAAEYIVKYEDEQTRRLEEEKRLASQAEERSNSDNEARGVMIVDDIPRDSGG